MYIVGWSDWADSFANHSYLVKMAERVIKIRKLNVKASTGTPYVGHKIRQP
jgi:accessory colonization factor AcfC